MSIHQDCGIKTIQFKIKQSIGRKPVSMKVTTSASNQDHRLWLNKLQPPPLESKPLKECVPLVKKCALLNSTTTLLHSVPRKLIFVDSLPPLSNFQNGGNSALLHSPGEVYTDVSFSSLFTFLRDFIILTYNETPTHKIWHCPERGDDRELEFPQLCKIFSQYVCVVFIACHPTRIVKCQFVSVAHIRQTNSAI